VKLVRIDGEVRAALYATCPKGPLAEEKARRAVAIPEGGEVLLPFDGEMPYPVEKVEWRDKRRARVKQVRARTVAEKEKDKEKDVEVVKRRKARMRVPEEQESSLSLLSGFLFDEIPAVPIVLLPDRDAVERYKSQEMKVRARRRKGKIEKG
jgi:hypothetical protein